MNELNNQNETAPAMISRRTLVKTAAWTAPAVAMAVAAPAASASAHDVLVSSISISSGITQPAWPDPYAFLSQTPVTSGGVVTLNLGEPTTALAVGQQVIIGGSSTSGYNGTKTITAASGTTISFSGATTGATTASAPTYTLASYTAPTLTLTFGAAHGFTAGQLITIHGLGNTLSGTFPVTAASVSSDNKKLTVTLPTGRSATASMPTPVTLPTGAVTNASSPSRATFTTTANHNLTVGQVITITGVAPAGYRATYVVYEVPTSKTFTVLTATTGNVTTAGSIVSAVVSGGTVTPVTPVMYSWIGGSPYTPSTVSWTDSKFIKDWNTGTMTLTYKFFLPDAGTTGLSVTAFDSIDAYGLTNVSSTTADTTAYAASGTAPSGAYALVTDSDIVADDGRTWRVLETPTKRFSGTDTILSIKLTSLTGYQVTSAFSTINLPRVGVKVMGLANYNSSIKPLRYTVDWAAPNAAASMSGTVGFSF
jgi:hypothetical protein